MSRPIAHCAPGRKKGSRPGYASAHRAWRRRALVSSLTAGALGAGLCLLQAETFWNDPATYVTPGWRGNAGSEFSHWDVFYSRFNGINYPDMAAPFGGVQGLPIPASEAGFTPPAGSSPSDPYAFWSTQNPTLKQVGTASAFLVGAGATGNIYSPGGTVAFELNDSTPFSLGTVNLQFQTEGTLIDYSSIELVYTGAGGEARLAPANFVTEYQGSGFSGAFAVKNRASAQWNLTGLGISAYKIVFHAEGSSSSFQELLLDTASQYSEATPSTRRWIAGGGANTGWSLPSNWGGSLPGTAGNVTFGSGSRVVVDGGQQEISQLNLVAPGSFKIEASSGSLKINSGIKATPAVQSAYEIAAPIAMSSLNLVELNGNADLHISGAISGAGGIYRIGSGVLRFTGSNSFLGGLVLDGGDTYLSGLSTFEGGVVISTGRLIMQGDARSSGASPIGVGSVQLGTDQAIAGVQPNASLILDGGRSFSRSIQLQTGANSKVLGAQNTGAGGASFGGAITLPSGSDNLSLLTQNVSDRLTVSGALSGGSAGLIVHKTGAGRVIYSGVAKTYLNDTQVDSGVLEIASGHTFTAAGNVTVAVGAELNVRGALGGSAALLLEGGTLSGAGAISRPFALDAGDILSPGDGIGALHTAAETWGSGGVLRWELGDSSSAPGLGWDFVDVGGALAITSAANAPFLVEVIGVGQGLNFSGAESRKWKIASASGGVSGFRADAFQVDAAALPKAAGGLFAISQSGSDIFLNYTAIPEPTVGLALMLAAPIFLGGRRRFRRH